MIVERKHRDDNISVETDLFSLAGRAALVAGGAYAIHKTYEDNPKLSSFFNTPQRKNPYQKSLGNFLEHSSSISEQIKDSVAFKKSEYFTHIPNQELANFKYGRLEDIDKFLTGGYKGYSAELKNSIDNLMRRTYSIEGKIPTLSYRIQDGELAQIRINTQGGQRFSISPVTERGTHFAGQSKDQHYIRSVYQHSNGQEKIIGADVAMTQAFTENIEKILNGELSVNDIYEAYRGVTDFSDKYGAVEYGSDAVNPEFAEMMLSTAKEDPGLKFTGQQMSSIQKKNFMIQKQKIGMAPGSAKDFTEGLIAIAETPMHKSPFAVESATSKSTIRDVQYRDQGGNLSFKTNKNTLFLNDNEMNALRKIAEEKGYNLGELAAEELIVNSNKAGSIIDRTRKLSVSPEAMSEHSEFLLKKIHEATGLSKEEFEKKILENGINGFSQEQKARIRDISLDDYGNFLEQKRDLIKAERDRAFMLSENPQNTPEMTASLQEHFAKLNSDLEEAELKLKNKNVFGKKTDLIEEVNLKRSHGGLKIDNLSYKDGKLVFGLREEKALGIGDKLHEGSGELKSVIKESIDLPMLLKEAHKRANGGKELSKDIEEFYNSIDFVGTADAMKKPLLDARNAESVFYSIIQKAKRHGDNEVLAIVENFHKNYKNLSDDAKRNVFNQLEQVAKNRGMNNVFDLTHETKGFGVMKSYQVGFGHSASYMGAGNLASFAERPIKNFAALGLNHFVKDIASRRINSSSVYAATQISATMELMKEKSYAGNIHIKDIDNDLMKKLFPNLNDVPGDKVLETRRAALAELGIEGNAYINLGEEINGVSKIPLFAEESFGAYIGQQVGSSGDYKKYTKLDETTKSIIYEMKKKERNSEKLKNLVSTSQKELNLAHDNLLEEAYKGKVRSSLYGEFASGSDELAAYAERLAKKMGTKNPLALVAAVHDEEFIQMFGQKAYDNLMQGNNIISDSWAMVTREPTAGLQHLPTNVVPASKIKANIAKGRIHVMDKDKHGNSFMKFLLGDRDGDMGAMLAARTKESAAEIKELAYGNSEVAEIYRRAQSDKAKFGLKGKTPENFATGNLEEIREGVARAKQLEKGEIGLISTKLEKVRNANYLHTENILNPKQFEKFTNVANTLHFIEETVIKSKHQSLDALKDESALKVISAIKAEKEYAQASRETRFTAIQNFIDESILGEHKDFAERIRGGDNSAEISTALEKAFGKERAEEILGNGESFYTRLSSKENIERILDLQEKSKLDLDPSVKGINLMAEETNAILKNKQKAKIIREEAEAVIDGVKTLGSKASKNIFKYAIAPAAFIGLMGTVFGSSSKVTSDKNKFSDAQRNHQKSSSTGNSYNPQMSNPRYMETEIRGSARGENLNLDHAQSMGGGSVHIRDDRRNFDKYEIKDIVSKGY